MSWYIYSSEALPNPEMMGKPNYTPDGSYIRWGGVALSPVPKKQWTKLPDSLPTLRRRDWTDRRGEDIDIPMRRFEAVVKARFAEIGVVMLDHEPSPAEKEAAEKTSMNLNLNHRKRQIEFFEQQRQNALARQGTYPPSPYIDECYDILGIAKPYSVEALEALRDPGAKAAKQMAEALTAALKKERQEGMDQAMEILTKPKEEPAVPAARR